MKIEITTHMSDEEILQIRALGEMPIPAHPGFGPGVPRGVGGLGRFGGRGPAAGPAMDFTTNVANVSTIVANTVVIGTFAGPKLMMILKKLSAMGKEFRRYPTDADK